MFSCPITFHSTFIRSKNKVELDHFYFVLNTWTLLRLVYVNEDLTTDKLYQNELLDYAAAM